MRQTFLLTLLLMSTACGAATRPAASPEIGPDSFAIITNADIAVGSGRTLVGIVGPEGERLGSPSDRVAIEVAPADDPAARQRADGAFTWILEPVVGVYRADFDFDRPGPWLLTVVPSSGVPLPASRFAVRESTIAPATGDRAPLVETPTIADAPIESITTDPNPDPRFYTLSLDEAVSSGRPTVAVFSTPGFCDSAACGPMLEQAKGFADDHPGLNFLHIEIYEGWGEPGFVPDGDHLSQAVGASGWNLPTEPWVFVIDGEGIITHRFEGVMDPSELALALG
jgi:hypothetical protein